jgi:hypothetical protein
MAWMMTYHLLTVTFYCAVWKRGMRKEKQACLVISKIPGLPGTGESNQTANLDKAKASTQTRQPTASTCQFAESQGVSRTGEMQKLPPFTRNSAGQGLQTMSFAWIVGFPLDGGS